VGTNYISDIISETVKATVIKFCTQVGYVNTQHKDGKTPLEWASPGSCDPL